MFSWRPGFPLVVLALITGLGSFVYAGWFSPGNRNDHFWELGSRFAGSDINFLTTLYLGVLGWLLLAGSLLLSGAASYLPAS